MLLVVESISAFSESDFRAEYALLDDTAKKRVDSATENSRRSTLAGRILLRRAVYDLYGKSNYEIYYNDCGKPLMDFCFFSISHSADMVICAVSDKPVGVDIERVREIKRAGHYPLFTSDEASDINSSENPSLRFLELWTQKEAYTKLLGGSVLKEGRLDLSSIDGIKFTTKTDNSYIYTVCEYAR